MKTQSTYKADLSAAMHKLMAREKNDGTLGMHFDCFWQCFRVPSSAPGGTNATYYVKQDMRDLIASDVRLGKFIYY